MYLLNLSIFYRERSRQQFTFHYVSIKSAGTAINYNNITNLHSTMYLLNHCAKFRLHRQCRNLHSTMYLLNLSEYIRVNGKYYYLHSTMYLLNRSHSRCFCLQVPSFTFHYVSIKSYLTHSHTQS